jgi:F-type H+-transporting ATPase subunit b
MDALLDSLGQLLLKALPTFFLLILLHLYLKWAFYKPLDEVLRRRSEATDGARKAAAESLARADRKTADYEEALRRVRAEIYREQEETRQRWQRDQAAAVSEARREIDATLREEKARIAAEAERARQALEAESEEIAEQITSALLERRAG